MVVANGHQCTLPRYHPARHRYDPDDVGYTDWRRHFTRINRPWPSDA